MFFFLLPQAKEQSRTAARSPVALFCRMGITLARKQQDESQRCENVETKTLACAVYLYFSLVLIHKKKSILTIPVKLSTESKEIKV